MNEKSNYCTPTLYVFETECQDIVCSSTDYDLSRSWKEGWSQD